MVDNITNPNNIPEEEITNHDVENLRQLLGCIADIWFIKTLEKGRDRVYDNKALDDFMTEFSTMVEELIEKRNIKDYISYVRGPHLTLEVPVKYS